MKNLETSSTSSAMQEGTERRQTGGIMILSKSPLLTTSRSSLSIKSMDEKSKVEAESNHPVIPISSAQVEEGEASMTEEGNETINVRLPLHAQSEASSISITQMPSTKSISAPVPIPSKEDKDGLIEHLRHPIQQMETHQQQTMQQRCQELESQLLHHANPSSNQNNIENQTTAAERTIKNNDDDDDMIDTETSIREQLKQEKDAIESQLNQALQTADTLRTELTKYRRSVTEDQLVLADLKGERNQLRQEVAQLKRRSQSIVSIQTGSDFASSSLSLTSNHDDDDDLMGIDPQPQEEITQRSSLFIPSDALIIQQLKKERDHLQSQLDESHRQNKELKAASKKVETEDKLIIQELKNERNELREKIARAAAATNNNRRRKSISTHTTLDESSRHVLSLDGTNTGNNDERDLLIQQLKQERAILQSRLARKAVEPSKQEQELVIRQLVEEREELRMKLLRKEEESSEILTKLGNNSSNASLALPSLDGSFQQLETIDASSGIGRQLFPSSAAAAAAQSSSTTTNTTPTKAPYIVTGLSLPPSGGGMMAHRRSSLNSISSRTSKSSAKLNELRAHKQTVETHLKSMVSPQNPKSMMVTLQKELSTNQQIIQEQLAMLQQSQTKQRSHERIIAEQKIQLRLMAQKIKLGIEKKKTNYWNRNGARLDRWKNRMQQDIEEKFDALLEQYSRQLDYVDREYDVRSYSNNNNAAAASERPMDGLFFWAKVLFIVLLWKKWNF